MICPFYNECTDISIDMKDLISWEVDGLPVQDAFPYLSEDEREIIISGICPACWYSIYGDADNKE